MLILCEMDGLLLLGALLGFTFAVSRPMLRAFGTGDIATAVPGPWRQNRLERWLGQQDWERILGLRYDQIDVPQIVTAREASGLESHGEVEFSNSERKQDGETASDEDFLIRRLETELIRATIQSVLDRLSFVAVEGVAGPVELSLPKARVDDELLVIPQASGNGTRFAMADPLAGQPVGAPTWQELPQPSGRRRLIVACGGAETLIPLSRVVFTGRLATIDEQAGQPVGGPSLFESEMPRSGSEMSGKPLVAVDFGSGQSDEEYRVAASLRRSAEAYAIAAYSLNPDGRSANSGAEENEGDGDSDPLDELLNELLEPPAVERDPNELELPLDLVVVSAGETCSAGQPIGAPDVFQCGFVSPAVEIPNSKPNPAEVDAVNEADDEEASAPVDREINRISERVELILSNALARPAPAINFQDALADIADRARSKGEARQEASRLPSPALEDNLARSADRDGALSMAEYKVQFEIFEGPLDLLLYLVRKQEVDIYEVNLTQIAGEFIKYVEMMRQFDLEVAGEFLVMASTLMFIKSRELLPVEQQSQLDDEEEDADPRWELIRQLVEYKKFKDAAANFKRLELAQEDVFPRNPAKPEFPVQELKANVSVFDLIGAVNKIIERIDSKEEREIFADRWTVSEKIEIIRKLVVTRDCVKFTELFEDAMSRTEVVATFLAILELIKLKVIVVEQPDCFSEIDIRRAPPGHTMNPADAQEEMALGTGVSSEFDGPAGEQE